MMQQQQSMFMGMQQYSQVISAQMPQMYGIGQYGMQQPMAPQFAQVPFSPQQRPGFSYGGSGMFGYGMGNQLGAASVSALGGAGQFALGGMGLAGGLGLMGRAGAMFDPISAGQMAYGGARALGFGSGIGMGAGIMAGGVVAGGMALAGHAMSSMVTGAQEQAGVNQSLGQFGFANSQSRSGRGFSRQDAMAIGGVVREMQALPEMMTSMSELTRIMDRMGQSGMMQGVRDAGEFSKKFKETIHVLKDVSKMMGSTMEEAMQAFQESRQAGFYSPQAIKQNILQRQITSGLTGMNQQQVNALQQYGAQSSVAMGGSRAGGSNSITRVSKELGMAQQMGLLTDDRVMELTGQGGSEGLATLAGSLNDVGQRMGRSSLGTAMTLALGETKDGRYTGNMDQDLVQRVRSGQINKEELLRLAHQKSAGRNAKLSFAAHRQRLTTEMVNSAGAQGMAMELSTILGERGFDNPDALNLVMQRYHVDESQANQVIQLMKDMPGIQRGIAEAGTTEARRMGEQAFMRANASFEGISRRIGKKFENALSEPFKKMGANAANAVGEALENFTDELFGRYSTRVTEMAGSTVLKAALGDKVAKGAIASARGSGSLGGSVLMNNNPMGQALNFLSGQQTEGEVQSGILSAMGGQYHSSVSGLTGVARAIHGGSDILDKKTGWFSESYDTTTAGQREAARQHLMGANPLIGKVNTTSGTGKAAMFRVQQELLHNPEMEGMTDQEKLAHLQKKLGPEIIDRLKKQTGSDDATDIIDALQQQGKLGTQVSAFTRKGLAGALGGAKNMAALANDIGTSIKDVSSQFGDKAALARVALTEGGSVAKILRGAFAGGPAGEAIQRALGEAPGTEVNPAILKVLGMSQKEFEAARAQGHELVQANKGGDATGAGIQNIINKQLLMADAKTGEHFKELGRGLSDRVGGIDIGGLSKGGQGLANRLKSLGGDLAGGKGYGDPSDLLSALAGYTGSDKSKLLGVAGEEIGAGVHEIEASRSAYRHSRSTKGGKSVDAFIEKMGLSGDVAAHVRELAKSDGSADISGSESKAIEKFLGSNATVGASLSKGGEKGTVNAAQNLTKTLETMNKNAEATLTALQNLYKQGQGGKT